MSLTSTSIGLQKSSRGHTVFPTDTCFKLIAEPQYAKCGVAQSDDDSEGELGDFESRVWVPYHSFAEAFPSPYLLDTIQAHGSVRVRISHMI